VRNALAAATCALAAGVPLQSIGAGLESFEPVKGRSRALAVALGGRTLTVVDDSYNANPDSVRAAIDVLAELPGPRLLVLGDMGEVGDHALEFHTEVGDWARQRGIEAVYALGAETAHSIAAFGGGSSGSDGRHFAEIDALNAAVLARLPQVGSVLVKGSRFMKMERVVQTIEQSRQQQKEAGHDA
jgi:UDP-N-acetylmuramoyl-tripeptide--D-alanyl-D-alanine ligase